MRVRGSSFDITYTYTYDANGNILSVSDGPHTTTYVYDAANQLVRENNQAGGFTHVWTYDDAGNILTRTEYAYTTGPLGTTGTLNPLRYRGYVYDTETGFYYLQSRYYDPGTGRFLNADAYASTGQGILRNNMFAYCSNNPVCYHDSTGKVMQKAHKMENLAASIAGGCGAAILVITGPTIITRILEAIVEGTREVYEFSQLQRQIFKEQKKKMPNVHHIVPIGVFSTRSSPVKTMLTEMRQMLRKADINPVFDPHNLTLVSSGTHAHLHTDQYIAHVYSYIIETGGGRKKLISALFQLRLEIAAIVQYASGY